MGKLKTLGMKAIAILMMAMIVNMPVLSHVHADVLYGGTATEEQQMTENETTDEGNYDPHGSDQYKALLAAQEELAAKQAELDAAIADRDATQVLYDEAKAVYEEANAVYEGMLADAENLRSQFIEADAVMQEYWEECYAYEDEVLALIDDIDEYEAAYAEYEATMLAHLDELIAIADGLYDDWKDKEKEADAYYRNTVDPALENYDEMVAQLAYDNAMVNGLTGERDAAQAVYESAKAAYEQFLATLVKNSLNSHEVTLSLGSKYQLVYTDENEVYNPDGTWTSSAPEVATVKNGLVRALSIGVTEITFTTADGEHTDRCIVNVEGQAASYYLSTSDETITVGDSFYLHCYDPNGEVVTPLYCNYDPSIVEVTEDGCVTGVGAGSTEIFVDYNEGTYEAVCRVTVLRGPSLNTEYQNLKINNTFQLICTTADGTVIDGTFDSSDPSIASVDAEGTVSGNSLGETKITFTSLDESIVLECTVLVFDYMLNTYSETIPVGGSFGLSPKSTGGWRFGCTIDISDPEVVSIEENADLNYSGGLGDFYIVRGLKEGSATITFTSITVYQDGPGVVQCEVTVTNGGEVTQKDIADTVMSLTSVVTKAKNGTYWTAYDGNAKTPALTVKDGSDTLTEGIDYTVEYTDNTKIGTATVSVTGVGNWMGTNSITFRITFTDVPLSHNYQNAVYWAVDEGIAAGYTGAKLGLFGVGDDITRGQVAMFLWRAAGQPAPAGKTQTFTDVPTKSNFYKAIQWAYEQGITGGYTGARAGQFGPSDNCTRGQIVMFLWRYAGKPAPAGKTQTFTDVPTSSNFYKAIQWASEQGITAGYKDGSFGVNLTCTRGHCVTFLYRLLAQ